VFGAGNSEGGILFVLITAWTTFVFLPVAFSTYFLMTVLSKKARQNTGE